MNFIKNFKILSKSDIAIAGGKGASLGEMTQAGLLVPPGFVVLSAGFEKFLEETDLNVEIDSILHSVNIKEMHTVENASEKIKDLILKAKIPKDISEEIKKEFKNLNAEFVAVRSSATAEDSSSAAWAGQLDTFLNTTKKTLLANVQKCWASLFTPRAIFYRFEKGLHNSKISVAVVVQKMVKSEISGIAFSVHPVTQDRSQIIIEAGYGLGEAIVSGQITPDSYVVEKEPRRIIDKNISIQERGIYRKSKNSGNEWQNLSKEKGEKQKLTDEQILELSELIIKIEKHYGSPQDIEWAYEKNKFYITQSRPITTLKKKYNKKEIIFDKFITRPYSIMQIQAYNYFLTKISEEINYRPTYPIFLYDSDKKIVHIYYIMNELTSLVVKIGEKITNDNNFRKKVFLRLNKFFNSVKKYFEGDVSIKTTEELILFFGLFKEYFKYIVYNWILPGLDFVPQEIRDEAMKLRKKTECYSGRRDKILIDSAITILNNKKIDPFFLLIEEIKRPRSHLEKLTKERSQGFLIYKDEVVLSSKITSFLKKRNFILKDPEITDSSEIQGTVAQKGYVKGVARIIYTEKDLKKISSSGDILVSPMTRPEFVPAIKIAGAIVTDEGGIICHAAIVAREMEKPCIIGTKIATQILKDGDLVEVDANKGVVRILEKQE